tara:strand:- start:331 stop:573 length:243 start_codon:yes stop_codon:yes gene_type:complete
MKKNKLFGKRIKNAKKDKKIGKKIFKGLVDTLPVPDIVKNQIDDKLNLTEKNHSELEQRVIKLENDVERIINILKKMNGK